VLKLSTEDAILANKAWNEGRTNRMRCDGGGKVYGRTYCGIEWNVIYYKDHNGKCAVLYPEGTGGYVYRDEENPLIMHRDFCDSCAEYCNVQSTRILIGPTNKIAFDF
jgi:hypothetical protein